MPGGGSLQNHQITIAHSSVLFDRVLPGTEHGSVLLSLRNMTVVVFSDWGYDLQYGS